MTYQPIMDGWTCSLVATPISMVVHLPSILAGYSIYLLQFAWKITQVQIDPLYTKIISPGLHLCAHMCAFLVNSLYNSFQTWFNMMFIWKTYGLSWFIIIFPKKTRHPMVPHGLSSYFPIKVTMFAIQWGDHDCTKATAPPGPGPYAGLSAEASNKMPCVSCTHDIISRICVYIYI